MHNTSNVCRKSVQTGSKQLTRAINSIVATGAHAYPTTTRVSDLTVGIRKDVGTSTVTSTRHSYDNLNDTVLELKSFLPNAK